MSVHQAPPALLYRVAQVLAWAGALVLVVIMLMTFADVIGRTFFKRSLIGTVETVTLLMGILVFFGLAWTEVVRRHVVVDTFYSMAPGRLRRVLTLLNALVAFVVASLLCWRLLIMTRGIIEDGEFTQIWQLPFWPTAVLESVGMLVFLAVLGWRVVEAFRALRQPADHVPSTEA